MTRPVLTSYPSRLEADVAVARLASSGIPAWAVTDSASGLEPQLDFIRGVRVLVEPEDLMDAAELLGVTPPPAPAPLSPEREQLVRLIRIVIFGVAAIGIIAAVVSAITG